MLLVDGADITQIAENARYVSLWNNGPGTLTFEYAAGKGKMYPNGCTVTFSYEGSNVFYGWLFKTSQTRDKFKCTCYDQLRYLKAKNSILREVEPLDSFLNRVGATHGDRIRLGQVDSTESRCRATCLTTRPISTCFTSRYRKTSTGMGTNTPCATTSARSICGTPLTCGCRSSSATEALPQILSM